LVLKKKAARQDKPPLPDDIVRGIITRWWSVVPEDRKPLHEIDLRRMECRVAPDVDPRTVTEYIRSGP
jgi:hypothetical protein